MLSYEEALNKALKYTLKQTISTRSPTQSLGRFLARNIYTEHPLPYWNNSAMDGYAIRHDDLKQHAKLSIIDEIPAGHQPQKEITKGTCARIFTGAPMPNGADTVVIQENVDRHQNNITIHTSPLKGANVRKKGEEFSVGDCIATTGTPVRVGLIGLFHALGVTSIPIYESPRIAIISTGDELVDRSQQQNLHLGQIWSSNNHTLISAITSAGGIPIDCGIARDNLTDTIQSFQYALSQNPDLILSTGGVSVGDHDRVQEALLKVGGSLDFWKVRLKPGKPLVLGNIQQTPFFGLPGNPVSALVSFWLFVYPIIRKAIGAKEIFLQSKTVTLSEDIYKRHSRAEFVRVKLSPDGRYAQKTGNQSSAWLSSVAQADALVHIPANERGFSKGSSVAVLLLP
ncbi:MAG: hypothetical protein CL916_13010 [Deltaproteobacteria bacterium]|nr:hypothetical protein [Deltaproteobacteria bacterium]